VCVGVWRILLSIQFDIIGGTFKSNIMISLEQAEDIRKIKSAKRSRPLHVTTFYPSSHNSELISHRFETYGLLGFALLRNSRMLMPNRFLNRFLR
jgi:hypothetical protein